MDQKPNFNYAYNNGESAAGGFRTQQNQREEDEVDLMEIIRVLAHHAWIIALAALIGAVLVGVGVKLFVPSRYTANATIYVFSTEGETSTAGLTIADKMTTDFQIIATTRETIELVIEQLGLDTTVEGLSVFMTSAICSRSTSARAFATWAARWGSGSCTRMVSIWESSGFVTEIEPTSCL